MEPRPAGILVLILLVAGTIQGQAVGRMEWDRRVRAARDMGWLARPTAMSELAVAVRRGMLGGRRPFRGEVGRMGEAMAIGVPLPATVDWRNHWGRNWMSPVRHQGPCGSCYVFGTVAVAEAVYRIEHADPDASVDFSEQLLLSCEPTGNCQDGGRSSHVLDYMKEQGTAQESCFPYRALDLPCSPCGLWQEGQDRIRVYDWAWISDDSERREAVMRALQEGPVIAYMTVYDDFYDYGGGVYRKTADASEEGGHIVALIGYDREQSCWIARNSWGTDWGEEGDFRVAWGEVDMGTWTQSCRGVTISNVAPVFGLECDALTIREGECLRLELEVTDPNHDPVMVTAEGLPEGATLSGGESWIMVWTPTYTQAGSYHLVFRASDGSLDAIKVLDVTVRNVKKTPRRY